MRNKKRIAANVAGIAVVLLVVAYAARPSPHVPPYDANLVRLAETERQGYCAGVTFWQTGGGDGDADLAKECRKEHPKESGRVNLVATERGFCRAIVDEGWEGTVSTCLDIMGTYQYWPTFDGAITDQWNRARPYPSTAIGGTSEQDDSRTGGRPGGPGHSAPSRSDSDYSDYYSGGTP